MESSANRAPLEILAVGDSYMPSRYFRQAFAALDGRHAVRYADVHDTPPPAAPTSSEAKLREYQGIAGRVIARMDGVDVLVVQGAPVTEGVLDAPARPAARVLRRGGPGERRRRRGDGARHPGRRRRRARTRMPSPS